MAYITKPFKNDFILDLSIDRFNGFILVPISQIKQLKFQLKPTQIPLEKLPNSLINKIT